MMARLEIIKFEGIISHLPVLIINSEFWQDKKKIYIYIHKFEENSEFL